jgi:hypothetical protein
MTAHALPPRTHNLPADPIAAIRVYDVRDAFAALAWLLAHDEDGMRHFLIEMKTRHPAMPGVDPRNEGHTQC